MDVLEMLAREPDDAIQIDDDKEAVDFLYLIGIANAFAAGNSLSEMPTVQICGFNGLKTHCVLACLFSGCSPENENGYQVFCAPRSAFEPGLSADDFVSGATSDPNFKGLRIIIRSPSNLN
jgi:hypothetical protein